MWVNILGYNMAKEDHMDAYFVKITTSAQKIKNIIFIKVPRTQNNMTYRLAKLAFYT